MEYFTEFNKLLIFLIEEWRLLLLFSFMFFIYFYYTNTFDYFEKRGVKYMKPTILFGNSFARVVGKKSFIVFQLDTYKYFKGQPFGGVFEGRKPVWYVFDPEIIKAIMIRDSDHFCDRPMPQTNEPRYIRRSILHLKGSEWKAVRSLITPAFSSARLKNMFPLIQQCTDQLVNFLEKYDKSDVDIKDVMVQLTLEITGVCAFGISTDTLKDQNAEFKKIAIKFNVMSIPKRMLLIATFILAPSMFKYMNFSFFNHEANKKLANILRKTRSERMSTGARRYDFLQLLIDASEKEKEDIANTKAERHLDDDTVDAQALIFLLAGFETSSTSLSFAIYEITKQPEIQQKLRDHIEEVTKGEEMSYSHLAQLDYLEAFISETLRMYPPITRIDRQCTKPYRIPGTSIQIDVGRSVAVPVYAIHMDPELYPEPEKFKPERFLRDEKNETPPSLFLTFGAGARNCIGSRFAMVVMKASLVALLRNYKFSICSKTEVPIKCSRQSLFLRAEGGVWVHVERL